MVLPSFVQKAIIGKPIIIYGDGNQSRSFIHVEDAVNALMQLMELSDSAGQIFNVGTDKEITIKDLAYLVREMAQSSSDIEYISYERAYGLGFEDMQRRMPDISRIRELIGFSPKNDLRDIIQSVINYYM
jgi:UDP-glucose 4-epimerase